MSVFGLLVTTAAGLIVLTVGWLGLRGRLPRNHIAGIRTPYTMRSDENWYASHRYAGPVLIYAGVAVAASGLALLPFAAAGVLPAWLLDGAVTAQVIVLLAAVIASWLYGTRKARVELGGP